ncbi:hypothetical protein [Streptomyces sp. NPDC093269]|uniref:hypothetical protein n=1 Tax=Streptomyces sp. NPDC093269 TaxID=3366038 RepID=UPI00380C3520
MTTDPRVRQLAQRWQELPQAGTGFAKPAWEDLSAKQQEKALAEAEVWLRAAVETKIAPLAERPTDKHDAVWMDDEGWLWGEYQTSPPTPLEDAAILRLVWESDVCSSKRELEERGVEFRLIGWSE